MTFRKFTEYGAASRLTVTIRTNDLLFISKSTLKQFNEAGNIVNIHIDDINSLIGIEFLTDEPTDGNFRKVTKENAGVSINVAPVLRFFGVKKLEKKFVTGYESKEGMLVFSIKELIERNKKTASDN